MAIIIGNEASDGEDIDRRVIAIAEYNMGVAHIAHQAKTRTDIKSSIYPSLSICLKEPNYT